MSRRPDRPGQHGGDQADQADRCHFDSELGRRVTARHQRYCESATCAGCQPCAEDHCRCGRHLGQGEHQTCARCVGRTRDDLERVRDLCRLAPYAAAEWSTSTDSLLVLAGPVPEHSTHDARRTWVHAGGLCRCASRSETCPDDVELEGPTCVVWHPESSGAGQATCGHRTCERIHGRRTCPDLLDWLENADGPDLERHPLWVLGTWDMLVGEHLEHDRRARVSVGSAARYLTSNLTYLAQDDTFAFDELARELRACRQHVERVMQVADVAQRGAPCPVCRAAGRKARPLERRYAEGTDDTRDAWVCPMRSCGVRLDLGEYDRMVWIDYLGHADRLTAAQVRAQYRVPEATLRQWAARGKVRRCGYDGNRRQLYDVGDVLVARGDGLDAPDDDGDTPPLGEPVLLSRPAGTSAP